MSSPSALMPDSGLFPRREFIREPKPVPNSFSLLAISSSNCIRLYSFPLPVIAAFQRFFNQRGIAQGFREDVTNCLCEFALEGKPWSSPKSLATERFLVEILSLIYQNGFTYLSTIDYGRESDDRLAIAFVRPNFHSQSSSPSNSPIPHSLPGASANSEKPKSRVPFALSFPSSTVLRVICPPLHSTPAILQAVRGAWPRGVDSERKVGENSFEFKLKGYRWFQEDTFAADSLRYILALLSSLDTHSFSLEASISLGNRSRVKDLWIFTGPPSPADDLESLPLSILGSSQADFNRSPQASDALVCNSQAKTHRRLITEPSPQHSPLPHPPVHGRAATDNVAQSPISDSHQFQPSPSSSSGSISPSHNIRKAAPRAQVPVSVHDTDALEVGEYHTALLPSTISDGLENMTGVGAGPATPDIFYSTSPLVDAGVAPPTQIPPNPGLPVDQMPEDSQPNPNTSITSPLLNLHTPSSHPPNNVSSTLLPPNVFKDSGVLRDSAFSSRSDVSAEIPIKWTGPVRESLTVDEAACSSSEPMLPGGWHPTPMEEKTEASVTPDLSLGIRLDQTKDPEEPVHEVRVASPGITDSDLRQSEAGLVDCITTSSPPKAGFETNAKGKERETKSGSGQGWVLVNVEGKSTTTEGKTAGDPNANSLDPSANPTIEVLGVSGAKNTESHAGPALDDTGLSGQSPLLPSAKAIVIIDAVEAKKSKLKKDAADAAPTQSRMRRFFSITRRDSPKANEDMDVGDTPTTECTRTRSRSGLSGRLKWGTPEATRNESNRRSID